MWCGMVQARCQQGWIPVNKANQCTANASSETEMNSSKNYASERGTPGSLQCSASADISLRFDGHSLTLLERSRPTLRVYPAVSGRPDDKGRFDYSRERQHESRTGPIPEGDYWVEPDQMWANHWYSLAPTAAWGFHRLTIHVLPRTSTFDRGGFFIHGGTRAGSAGCINLHGGMERFVSDLDQMLRPIPHCFIPLTVKYGK